jgi:hypothetical protein
METIKLKHANFEFTFAITEKPKKHKTVRLTKTLYAVAKLNENGEFEAHINTKGITGYDDITVIPFSLKSFDLKYRNHIWLNKKDKYDHWVHIIRTDIDAMVSHSESKGLTTLVDNGVFSGRIIKENDVKKFDMINYKGDIRRCEDLLNKINNDGD